MKAWLQRNVAVESWREEMNKRRWIISSVLIFAISGFGTSQEGNAEASAFPDPPDGPLLDVATAPTIVVGTAGVATVRMYPDEDLVRTLVEFHVESVERGSIKPGDDITVTLLGGATPDLAQVTEHQASFVEGERSRLFLTEGKVQGTYEVFGWAQGKQDEDKFSATGFHVASCAPYCLTGYFWPFSKLPVGYKVNANTSDVAGEEVAVQAGFNSWEEASSRMDSHYNGSTLVAQVGADGTNAVYWKPNGCGGGFVGCASTFYDPGTGEAFQFDIEMNDTVAWTFVEGNSDIESTVVHEAGHVIGLDHVVPNDCSQVMGDPCPDQRVLGSGDTSGLRALYPGNVWNLRNANSAGLPDITVGFGISTDSPLVGDWDGNGTDTPGVFRSPNLWFLDNQFDGVADVSFSYGLQGDKPVVGDWDGDGDATPGVVRGNVWYLNNSTDATSDFNFGFGSSTDMPLVGNWDGASSVGEGCGASAVCADTVGVFRPSDKKWFLNNNFDSANSGVSDVPTFTYGITNDTPAVGNWDALDACGAPLKCHDTPAIFRAPNGWYLNNGFDGFAEVVFNFGRRGSKLAGNWDGTSGDTIGVR